MQDRRRLIVGIVSVTAGIAAMAWLITHRDRFRTRADESACQHGDPEVCLRLADTYLAGQGVRQDADLAQSFEERAYDILDSRCQSGDKNACFRLGTLPRGDRDRARRSLRRACDLGLEKACVR
jgi:TPR repeat protein